MKERVKKGLFSVIFSILFLYAYNMLGSFIGLHIPINIWTIALVALLRVPGVILLIIILMI